MHDHDHDHDHEHGEYGERGGRRGRGFRGPWFAGPWAGPEEGPEGPEGGPHRMWFGGPFAMGGPFFAARGWGRPGGRGWGRARRGDVRSAILVLLTERPMHGYEIISELSERTEGLWRPSPGSIYPTLQLLEDEGLVIAGTDENAGKRRYSLTEEGRETAAELAKGAAPWEQMAAGAPAGTRSLRHAVAKLMPVVGQVVASGGPHECEEAVKVLEEARRRLYAILAGEHAAAEHTAGPATGTAPAAGGPVASGSA